MKGTNNPMCRTDVAAKMSQTRSQRFKDDPSFRELVSSYTRQAWADGKYDGVKTGKRKWYDHVRPDGSTVKLQGTWEVVFARYLDAQNVLYDAHKGRIPYRDGAGVERSYYPDFFVPSQNRYYDVKGAFWDDAQRDKVRCVIQSNPDIKLDIINRDVFKELGINVDYEAKGVT